MKINDTQAIVLGILHKGHLAGTHIARKAAEFDGHWNVTRSQVYRELPVLADKGLLLAGEPDAKKRWAQPYYITQAGREAYWTWFDSHSSRVIQRDPWVLRYKLSATLGDVDPLFCTRAAEYFQILSENETDPLLRDLYMIKFRWFSAQLT